MRLPAEPRALVGHPRDEPAPRNAVGQAGAHDRGFFGPEVTAELKGADLRVGHYLELLGLEATAVFTLTPQT